eukprot:12921520-Prorocentrum_lima.AAC.1
MGYPGDMDEWTSTEIISSIVDVNKDALHEEFVGLDDNDLKLTIHFPSQFEMDHVQEIVEFWYTRLWAVPPQ